MLHLHRIAPYLTSLCLVAPSLALAQETSVDESPFDASTLPPAPTDTPPAPPAEPPPPSIAEDVPPTAVAPPAADGQWVYTDQYGWVWMPYADRYSYVELDGTLSYAYVYAPAFGWSWVFAPWILGWGPRPYWGTIGYTRFGWHAHPWFHRGPRWRRHDWGGRLVRGRVVHIDRPHREVRREERPHRHDERRQMPARAPREPRRHDRGRR